MTDRIPLDHLTSDQLDQLYDELDRAEATVERLTALAVRWLKDGPPPFGASIARWWDARFAELKTALNDPKERP